MSLPVRTTPEADAQIREIDSWWRRNRLASPNLFARRTGCILRHHRRRTQHRPPVSTFPRTGYASRPAQGHSLSRLLRPGRRRGEGACGVACAAWRRATASRAGGPVGGVPTGIRTRVLALKGPRPRPLDDGDSWCEFFIVSRERPLFGRPVCGALPGCASAAANPGLQLALSRPMRQQEAANVAHRQRNLLRRVFPGVHAQLAFWREHRALDRDGQ